MVTDRREPKRPSRDPGGATGAPDGRPGIDRPGPAVPPHAAPRGRPRIETVAAWLASLGAEEIPHPGGTLSAHLRRVHALLDEWGARPALRLAGLCHAYYGTDGFPTALGDIADRARPAAVIGAEAERLVHFYACGDRRFSYPHLAEPAGPFKDRFTGAVSCPPLRLRRDFAELTVANELDLVRADPGFRARLGPELRALFASWRTLISAPAWRAVQATLP